MSALALGCLSVIRRCALGLGLGAASVCSTTLLADPPIPPGGDPIPGQPAVIHDSSRSDPFCVRVEELMADGLPRAAAVAQASREVVPEDGEECLYYALSILYSDDTGKVHRFSVRINAKCLDDMWTTPGCTPLTCPPGVVPPAPCNLPACTTAGQVPMWDTTIDPVCFGLPTSVTCAWIYPQTTTPEWGPCEKILDTCVCFPEFATCAGLAIECRNPVAPKRANDPCPNCE
jgi:hypothetical protein